MKRLLLFLSALMLSIAALWAHDVEVDGIYYNLYDYLYDKTAEVTYRGSFHDDYSNEYLGSVTIPETITYNSEIYSVTSIGDDAFNSCSGLTSVTIPNSVTSIGLDAFYDCSGLTKVNYLGTVDKWVEIYFENAVSNPTYYAEDLYINNELLTDVKITTANSIKDYAFYNCQSIKSVEIGESVTSIHQYAFSGCSGLTKVNYLDNVDTWVEIDFEDPKSNPTYYAKDLYINNELLTDVKITTSDSIKNNAFYNCQSIKSVEIGKSVTYIGDGAFYNCSGLTKVTIPNSVTYIGYQAFSGCSGLTSVTIPNSVTSIGWSAFSGCSGLISVTIPNSVTYIGYMAFSGTGIYNNNSNWDNGVLYIDNCLIEAKSDVVKGSYTIKEGTRIIGERAFSNCSGLTSVTIPNSVTSISYYAFFNCSGLTSVTIPNSVTYIGYMAFSGTGIYNNNSNWDNGVLYIDNWLIEANSNVVKGSYTIKEGTRIIGYCAFWDCRGLTSVTIPNSVTSIGSGAFAYCRGLTSVIIPNSITYIDYDAFRFCGNLKTVYNCSSLDIVKGTTSNGCVAYYADEVINACPTDVIENLADANITISEGVIYCPDSDFVIYNTIGQNVTTQNGSLTPGVYVVQVADDFVKVMMK